MLQLICFAALEINFDVLMFNVLLVFAPVSIAPAAPGTPCWRRGTGWGDGAIDNNAKPDET